MHVMNANDRTPNYKIQKADHFRKYLFENSVTMKFQNFSAKKIPAIWYFSN